MSIPISGSDNDNYFEEHVEDEWKVCVNHLNWLRKEKPYFHIRGEVMKRYWENRLEALAPVIHKERVCWLKELEARYPSGIGWSDEVLKM